MHVEICCCVTEAKKKGKLRTAAAAVNTILFVNEQFLGITEVLTMFIFFYSFHVYVVILSAAQL